MHTTRAKRCMKCTVIITVWRKDIEHNTHNIKVVNSGEWYHCSFPVDGKELIPDVAISSLRKKKTDDSREYQIPGLIYSQLFVCLSRCLDSKASFTTHRCNTPFRSPVKAAVFEQLQPASKQLFILLFFPRHCSQNCRKLVSPSLQVN